MSAPATIARPPWRRAIALAQLALAALAIVDVAWAAIATGLGALPTARALLAAIGLALPAGAVVGAIAALIRWGWNQRRAPTAAELIAAPLALATWALGWLAFAWLAVVTFHAPALTALAIALAGFALVPFALAIYGGARRALGPIARRWPRAAPWVLAGELALGVALAPWQRGTALVCVAGLIALATRAFATRWLDRVPARALAVATLLATLAALSPLGDDRAGHAALAGRAVFLPGAERVLARVLDFDGDGHLSLLGGGDCAGFDASRSPDGVELAGNGVDEDCRYGDLQPALAAAPPPPGPPADRVALLTIAGLGVDADGNFTPAMPELARRAAAGIRFAHPVGVEGRFRDVAGALIAGDLPTDFTGAHGGFPTGGATIPALLERVGGEAVLALPKAISADGLATQFARERTANKTGDAAKIVAEALRLAHGPRAFVWAHLVIGPAGDGAKPGKAAKLAHAADAAAAKLVDELLARPGVTRVLVVGLSADTAARPNGDAAPRGGPLALIGSGLAPARVDASVGFFDVYPTLLDALGLAGGDAVLGASLLRPLPARAGALAGWIDRGGAAHIAAAGDAGLVVHEPDTRELLAAGDRLDEDAAGPAALAPLIALVRDGWLAPRLQARNQALAAARSGALPDDLDGAPATIGGALRILGCTSEVSADRQAEVTLYVEGGERLLPGDLLAVKLSSAHSGSMRSRVAPVGGAYPFGSWRAGERVAHTMHLDLRPVNPGTAILWIGVARGDKLLRVEGPGATPDYGRICNVEVPPR